MGQKSRQRLNKPPAGRDSAAAQGAHGAAAAAAPAGGASGSGGSSGGWESEARHAPVLRNLFKRLKRMLPDDVPLPAQEVSALVGAVQARGSSTFAAPALVSCEQLGATSLMHAQQLMYGGLIGALLDCIRMDGRNDSQDSSAPAAASLATSAWRTLACLERSCSSDIAAALVALGEEAFAGLMASAADTYLGPSGSIMSLILPVMADAEPTLAAWIAGSGEVLQAAVEQTLMPLPPSGQEQRFAGLILHGVLLQPDMAPSVSAAAAATPRLVEAAVHVIAVETRRRLTFGTVSLMSALEVLHLLLNFHGNLDAAVSQATVAQMAATDAIQHILQVATGPNAKAALQALRVCFELGSGLAARRAVLQRHPSVLVNGLLTTASRFSKEDNASAVLEALELLGCCLDPSPEGLQVRRAIESISPARAADVLRSMAKALLDFVSKRELAHVQISYTAAIVEPLLIACAAAGKVAKPAAAPRALEALARYLPIMFEDDGPSSSGSDSGSDADSDNGAGELLEASDNLVEAVEGWAAFERRAAAQGASPCWVRCPADLRALLDAMQAFVSGLEGKPRCDEAMQQRCEAVVALVADLADGKQQQQQQLSAAPQPAEEQEPAERQGQGEQQEQPEQQPAAAPSAATPAADVASGSGGQTPALACATCGAASGPGGSILKRCKGCRSPFPKYCSAECYQAGWPAHKAACKAARAAQEAKP